jgi:hypothetical protein
MADDAQNLSDLTHQISQTNTLLKKVFEHQLKNGDGKDGKGDKDAYNKWKASDLKGATKTINDFAYNLSSTHDGFYKLTQQVTTTHGKMTNFGKELDKNKTSLGGMSKLLLGTSVALGMELTKWVSNTFNTFRDLTGVGQTFGGSLLNMQIAAAQAGLPLRDFAQAIKDYPTQISAMGQKQFFGLNKGLRDNLEQFGQLSLSVAQTTQIVGIYSQSMGTLGRLQNINQRDAAASLADLATESSALAVLTGKDRMELLKNSSAALKDATLQARAMEMSGEAGQKFAESAQKAVLFMSALPGDAGQFFGGMMATTLGSGTSLFTAQTKTLVNAGLGQVSGAMDALARKEKSGTATDRDRAAFYQQTLKIGEANLEGLRLQAMAGNQDAAKMIQIITDMENNKDKFTEEGIRKAKEEATARSGVTTALGNLEKTYNDVTSGIKLYVLDVLKNFLTPDKVAALQGTIKALMGQIDTMVQKIFNKENLDTFLTFATNVGNIVIPAVDSLASGITWLVKEFNDLAGKFGGMKVAIAGLLGVFLAWKAAMRIKDELKASANRVLGREVFKGVSDSFSTTLNKYATGNALRTFDVNDPNNSNKGGGPVEPGAEEEGGKGGKTSSKGRFSRTLGKVAGGFNKYGLAGLTVAGTAAGALMPEGKTKDTVGAALSGAQQGMAIASLAEPIIAMLGPMGAILAPFVPLIGAGIGAAVGAISENWDTIKKSIIDGVSWVGDKITGFLDFMSTGIMKYTPLGAVINLVKELNSKGLGGTLDDFENSVIGVFDTVKNVFHKILDPIKDMISKFVNFSFIDYVEKFLPEPVVKMIDEIRGGKSSPSTPKEQESVSVPKVEFDQMKNTIATLQKQIADQQKDNATLHKQLDKLIATVQHGNHQNAAINSANLHETKKSNNILGNPLTGVV